MEETVGKENWESRQQSNRRIKRKEKKDMTIFKGKKHKGEKKGELRQ